MKLPIKLQELVDDFKEISDKNQRMDMLIYYAEDFEQVPEEIAKQPYPEENKVPACESQAYVWSSLNPNQTMNFYFAVENPQGISAKAMAAIITDTLSGETPDEIAKIEPEVVYELFGRNMSMGKSAGLTSLINIVRSHAIQAMQNN